MRTVLLFLILGVALVLQATVFDFIRILGAKPDLVMLIAVLYGFIYGSREGAFFGFLSGLLVDFFTGHNIGFNALAYMGAAYVGGMGEDKLYKENLLIAAIVSFVGTFAGQVINYLLLLIIGINISPLDSFLQVIIPAALYNAIITPLVYGWFYRSNTKGLLKMPEV